MERRRSLMGCFFGNEVTYQGPKGRKVQNQARIMEETNKQPQPPKKQKQKQKPPPKAEWLVTEGRQGGAGHWRPCAAPCVSVTEGVLAGRQTAIRKHHEGKHQSTLDFFFIIFFFFCKHFRQTHNAFQRCKRKCPFPPGMRGEGKDSS